METIRTEGVVLRRRPVGEADRLLTVFTRKLGKLVVLARGVRWMQSKMRGHLEPFTLSRLIIVRSRRLTLAEAETVNAFPPLRRNLVQTAAASHLAELLIRLLPDEEPNEALFELFLEHLSRLAALEQPECVMRTFEFRLLALAGFAPEVSSCGSCRAPLIPPLRFSVRIGGILCRRCVTRLDRRAVPMSEEAVNQLRAILAGEGGRFDRAIADQLSHLSRALITHYFEQTKFYAQTFFGKVKSK